MSKSKEQYQLEAARKIAQKLDGGGDESIQFDPTDLLEMLGLQNELVFLQVDVVDMVAGLLYWVWRAKHE